MKVRKKYKCKQCGGKHHDYQESKKVLKDADENPDQVGERGQSVGQGYGAEDNTRRIDGINKQFFQKAR